MFGTVNVCICQKQVRQRAKYFARRGQNGSRACEMPGDHGGLDGEQGRVGLAGVRNEVRFGVKGVQKMMRGVPVCVPCRNPGAGESGMEAIAGLLRFTHLRKGMIRVL
ncbi:MAG: hypothetical protein RQ750_03635 [Roseovarius sp.]|nr:hypothetical protein [Roseovarius sp.]